MHPNHKNDENADKPNNLCVEVRVTWNEAKEPKLSLPIARKAHFLFEGFKIV